MKTGMTAALVVVAASLAAGCSTLQVQSDYDPAVDFGKYRTYTFKDGTKLPYDIGQRRLESGLFTTLAAKGLKKEAEGGDLSVFMHSRIDKRTQIDTTNYGFAGPGWGWGGWGWGGGYGTGYGGISTSEVREIPVGKVLVDLVDAKEKKLVWRGWATADIDDTPSEQEEYDKGFAKLFANFPPKKK